MDPQMSSGQPEGRVYMAFFDGLTEYHPKTMAPIPAIAERWESSPDLSEFTFYLRRNARWSNGDPLTAHDVEWSWKRGLSPDLASRTAYMAYYIRYAQGYNEGAAFARDPRTGQFVMDGALRLVVPGDEKGRAQVIEARPEFAAILRNAEFVPITAADVGVRAIDEYTLKVELIQSAPFFVDMTPHQFFRIVPRKAIEQYGSAWTEPGHIITSGAFRLREWVPYDRIVGERDPMYWDAANVRLDEIHFYPLEDNTVIMNLYKAGEIEAGLNHSVPASWIDSIKGKKDFMSAPEMVNEYYQINTTRPPMNDLRVRKAFNISVDREALANYRRTAKPLYTFMPVGIFPGYPVPAADGFDPERAKRLLAEAGYKSASGEFDPSKFPVDQVDITYNTSDSNKQVAEFIQAQWKQNLGVTIPLRNMEFKTFLSTRAALDYKGFARSGWIGDYVDPFTYLNLFSTPRGDNGTGWWDPKYAALLDDANRTLDPAARYAKLAQAERMLLDHQAVIGLLVRSTDWMKKPYVKGMYPNSGTMHAWKFVYIERDPAKWDYGVPDMTP